MYKRIFIIVLDSVGVGELPDAKEYGDVGSNTLGHIAREMKGLKVPNMENLGLGNLGSFEGIEPTDSSIGVYTKMKEKSVGKDTMTGHWEMMGLHIKTPFRVFENGFPDELIKELEEKFGRKIIGNIPASGTEIIEKFGKEHMETGAVIVYTSADSVLQIAAHEEVVPIKELYRYCEIAREITLNPRYMLGRIIARPFIGEVGSFKRTSGRHDYALKPFGRTVMNELKESGYDVIALGKISDIYNTEGITESFRTVSNMDGMDKFIDSTKMDFKGISFLNLVDFDALYGHRRDAIGYGKALEEFDERLYQVLEVLKEDDMLIITADHGNDPTFKGTDHTREYVPLLVYSKDIKNGKEITIRESFADIGATISENFNLKMPQNGISFLGELK